jgi:putative oxidoreductase
LLIFDKIMHMKRFFSIAYPDWTFHLSMLLLRVTGGALMIPHGYHKLVEFDTIQAKFMNFMGIGQSTSLALVVFAEFFCSLFLVAGLFTRLAAIPLVIAMIIAVAQAHHYDVFGEGETASLYLANYLVLLLCGPGKISIDGIRK